MIQAQEAPGHGECHRETVPHAEKPAHCRKLAYVGLSVVQRADQGAESPCPPGPFCTEPSSLRVPRVAVWCQSPCLPCAAAATQGKRNAACVSEML